MLGAIIGDIVGSAYEFNPTNDYNFEMFKEGSAFTDDTICTIAIADALLKGRDFGESLHDWCRRYMKPKGGFGGRFRQWVESDNPKPYGSYGNGSAMRVSPIGMWFSNDWDKVLEEAKKSAECTHNHPEGIHGAQCVADAVHFAVVDCDGLLSAKKINDFVIDLRVCKLDDYNYDPDTDYENFRGKFDETCQGTVPPALDIISKSRNFEDAIRRAVSLAADADTLGAIVGSIAEHIWGIPSDIKEKAMTYLPEEMRKVVDDFYLALENKKEYKPKDKEISGTESMMFWKLGAGDMSKFLSMENGMPSKEKKATAQSWKTKELPKNDVSDIPMHFEIPADKMLILLQGHIPDAQEDHWFMYCDESHIRYYRSWTGECAFEAHFRKEKEMYIIDHLLVNHALNEFGVNGDVPAKVLFLYLVYSDIEGVNHRCWLEYLHAWEEQYKINVDAADEAEKKANEEAKKNAEADPFAYNEVVYGAYRTVEKDQLYYSTGGSTGTLQGRTTPVRIDELGPNEIFVFGSNAQGYHGGGAAHAAMQKFGAEWGKGDGLQGRSYAISTMEGLLNTARNINRFIEFASKRQDLRFLVTPIGCGIAGYTPLQIAPLFRKAITLPNVFLPRIFWEYFWITEEHHPDYFTPDEGWKKWNK